jgi:hypothetical protein
MPAGGRHNHRDHSLPNNLNRSTSQPVAEYHYNYLLPHNSNLTHPMKNFVGNLLHLPPNRYISPFNTLANRSKLSSSLSTTIHSERSSRVKVAHTSVVSSFSIRSLNARSPQEIRVDHLF